MKEKDLKVAKDSVSALMQGKFVFDPTEYQKIFLVIAAIFILFMKQAQMHFLYGMKMECKIKTLQETKNIFGKIEKQILKAYCFKIIKKPTYVRNKLLPKLIDLLEDDIDQINDIEIPTRADYVVKKRDQQVYTVQF